MHTAVYVMHTVNLYMCLFRILLRYIEFAPQIRLWFDSRHSRLHECTYPITISITINPDMTGLEWLLLAARRRMLLTVTDNVNKWHIGFIFLYFNWQNCQLYLCFITYNYKLYTCVCSVSVSPSCNGRLRCNFWPAFFQAFQTTNCFDVIICFYVL